MKRFGDFLVNTPSALVLLAAGVVLLVCAVVPPLHGTAWLLLVLAVLLLAGAVLGWSLTWTHLQSRIDALASEAADAYETYTPVQLSQTPQEELARADSQAAKDITERFPENDGLVRRLRIEAEVTEFPDETVHGACFRLAHEAHLQAVLHAAELMGASGAATA